MPIELTRKGYIELWKGGVKISQHVSEWEAMESLSRNGNGDYEIRFPRIMARAYGVLNPDSPDTDTIPPSIPQNVVPTAVSATQIDLTWDASTDNLTGISSYQLYRNGVPVNLTVISTSYSDTGLSPGTTYSYTVAATDGAGNQSGFSTPVDGTTQANNAPAWSGLEDQTLFTDTNYNFSLDTYCTDADGDTITYSLASGALPTGLAFSGARNQTISGQPTTDGAYAFTLRGSDPYTGTNLALTWTVQTPDTTPPAAPNDLRVTALNTNSVTMLLPTSAALDHDSFRLERSADGVSWGTRFSGLTGASVQDTGLSINTLYYYRVRDIDTSGNVSDPSGETSIFTTTTYPVYPLSTAGEGSLFDNDTDVITNQSAIWGVISKTEMFGTFSDIGAGGRVTWTSNGTPGSDTLTYKVWDIDSAGTDGTGTATFGAS